MPPSTVRRVAISGASGLVGSALAASLEGDGVEVLRLVRSTPGPGEARWDPTAGTIDAAALEGVDAVVHLAGESIAQRWTPAARRRIRESRVAGTRLLAETLASLRDPPDVLLSASGVDYYPSSDAPLDETAAAGEGFLAGVVREWEAAAGPAARAGIRVVHTRAGMVLSPEGGALERMLPPFRLGVGGRVGSGRQWMSWISRPDLVRAMRFLLADPAGAALSGPVNATAPEPVTNEAFTRALGGVLGRPTLLAVPATAIRLLFGEMGEATLLASHRVRPARLLDAGFTFLHPRLEDALRAVLRAGR